MPLNVSFWRSLVAANLNSWHNLVLRISNIHLNERSDVFRWSLKTHGQFSVCSMYQALLDLNIVPHNSYLWKIKIPLKIKLFLWLVYREEILIKDNLVKRSDMKTRCVIFVRIMRQYNIFSFNALSLSSYGGWYK
jgi:hypothetical protein